LIKRNCATQVFAAAVGSLPCFPMIAADTAFKQAPIAVSFPFTKVAAAVPTAFWHVFSIAASEAACALPAASNAAHAAIIANIVLAIRIMMYLPRLWKLVGFRDLAPWTSIDYEIAARFVNA
jgi:hypothetical protein